VSRSNEEVRKLGQNRDHARQADERRTLQINTVTTGYSAYPSAGVCHRVQGKRNGNPEASLP
jgi:hypothetical protein